MPNDFHQDMQDNSAQGAQLTDQLNEFLAAKGKNVSSYEKERNRHLGSQVGAGLTGLNYLTGNKKPEVETFYDAHPLAAISQNAADSAPLIGAGVAAGGTGWNLFQDMMRSRKVNEIGDDMRGSGGGDDKEGKSGKGKFLNLDGKDEKLPDEMKSIFGHMESTKSPFKHEGGPDNPHDNPAHLVPNQRRRDVLSSFNKNKGINPEQLPELNSKMRGYSKFHQVLSKISPHGSDEEIARMVESNLPKFTGESSKLNLDLLHPILAEHLGGNERRATNIRTIIENRHGRNQVKDVAGRMFGGRRDVGDDGKLEKQKGWQGTLNRGAEGLAKRLPSQIKNHRIDPSILRGLSRAHGPGLLGGGIALGGMALSPILNQIHKHTYGDEKMKEWTNNMRMVHGKFDEVQS
jgi:hypothetical protein